MINTISKEITRTRIIIILIISVLVLFWFSIPSKLFETPQSKVLLDSDNKILGVSIAADEQWRMPLQGKVPEKYKTALIYFEDEYFHYHLGVNPISLLRAAKQYIKRGKIISGGSTISMQVIRLSRQNKNRSIQEKLKEILLAFRMELSYSKEEILKMYASNAPFGGNIVGIEAASWKYFKRSPNDLSWSEAALLAVLPNAPSLIFPGKNTKLLIKKRNKLLDKLQRNKIIDSLTCTLAKQEEISNHRYSFPQTAQHLIVRASRATKESYIHTTINSKIQNKVNNLLDQHSKNLQANGINNMSALVVDVKSGNILAYVGNCNYNSNANDGNMVDIITSKRSSGSIIKPILYALIQQKGYILPNTLIPDIPIKFGSYAPKNFSLQYDGAVAAGDALARSLNIPSVNMLKIMTVGHFYDSLPSFGITTVNKGADHYGLSIILGGAEVTLEEVASVYSGMARTLNHYNEHDGMYYNNDFEKIKYIKEDISKENTKLDNPKIVSAAAIWLTFKALLKVKRPEEETGWDSFLSANNIAWKTGTSYGFRDAWAVGVTPKYVVAVWAGNADGEGRAGLVGVKAAAPLMFDIFSNLPSSNWFIQPVDEMEQVLTCKHSGYRASSNCIDIDTTWIMREGLRTSVCPYCKIIHLDKSERFRINSSCNDFTEHKQKSFFILPPIMEWYYKKNNPNYKTIPPYRSDCKENDENLLDIVYPDNNTSIFIPKEMGGNRAKIIFEAAHRIENTTIYWHIDNHYIGETRERHQIEVAPSRGIHTLTLIDEYGNSMKRKFEVK